MLRPETPKYYIGSKEYDTSIMKHLMLSVPAAKGNAGDMTKMGPPFSKGQQF